MTKGIRDAMIAAMVREYKKELEALSDEELQFCLNATRQQKQEIEKAVRK